MHFADNSQVLILVLLAVPKMVYQTSKTFSRSQIARGWILGALQTLIDAAFAQERPSI